MSTVILLSSSPPKTFAPSPTPAGSSSPGLPSPHAILSAQPSGGGHKRFKTANVQRDGFGGGFSATRCLLSPNARAENVPVGSQKVEKGSKKMVLSPKRFKDPMTVTRDGKPGPVNILGKENERLSIAPHSVKADCATRASETIADIQEVETSTKVRAEDVLSRNKYLSPLNLDRAITRRMDWTPPEIMDTTNETISPVASLSASFSGGLFGSFGYSACLSSGSQHSRPEIEVAPTKRRRLDLVDTGPPKSGINMLQPESGPDTSKKAVTASKKAKARKKVPLTITKLATANYFGNQAFEKQESPHQQFLTSTQAYAYDKEEIETPLETAKPKRMARKSKSSKKAAASCPLYSPESAMKAMSNQDALFGSVSQLARDESPRLMRDTLEALRRSESFMMSDPIPTQNTEPISIESTTPRADRGTSRFANTRGLWSAAGRDEDNALLHVDTVDMFDTPHVRLAFAGKDVLLQPSVPRARYSRSPEKQSPYLRGGYLASANPFEDSLMDIDDIYMPSSHRPGVTGSLMQTRGLHTSPNRGAPRKRLLSDPAKTITMTVIEMSGKNKVQTKPLVETSHRPIKPSYVGFSTGELQKQLAAYHFKPVKKREKMIEMLEKCWEAKNGADADTAASTEPTLVDRSGNISHTHLLSNVHGLGSRPMPKVKKTPGRLKKVKELGVEAKEPKKRKKAEPKLTKDKTPITTKTPRKRKSKADALSEGKVVDVDDIEVPATENLSYIARALIDIDEIPAVPSIQSKTVKTPAKSKAKAKKVVKPVTLPPTRPEQASSPPAFATPIPAAATAVNPISPGKDMQSQIKIAITSYVPSPDRNHQQDPTWHEKILMYDPVILEDLAAWLNTTGLGKIGEDREVGAIEVRDWLEKQGICCLWKGGWRGNKAGASNAGED